ncbi:hypothetical protein ACKWTF_006549 [Chironomus riparius]
MVYAFKTTSELANFPTYRLLGILCYVHFVLLEISYNGSATQNEINNLFGILRRIHSKAPLKENLPFLDIHNEAVKLNCGLICFDWEIMKMVISTEAIYFVTLSQFNELLDTK